MRRGNVVIAVIVSVVLSGAGGAGMVWAEEPAPVPAISSDKVQRKQKLEQRLKEILDELESLKETGEAPKEPTPSVVEKQVVPEQPTGEAEIELKDMSIVSRRVQKRPEGVGIVATVPAETDSQPTRNMRESLESLPGVVVRQANGPRDFSISIRGSGVKTGFAIRELKLYEDGFIQTQSDGLSRLDIHDPWFMRSVEVTKGASSSLYDNYATGGMVHFRTRRGSDINGFETFLSGGSYGFNKQAFAVGKQYSNLDVSLFASNVGEDGYITNSDYNTQTLNFNFRLTIDSKQSLYFKAITNWLDSRVPTRLTVAQFNADDRQGGGGQTTCTPGTYSASCANAQALNQQRIDRRTIIGGMYEREIDPNTVLTIEADYDVKDINQYFTQITDNVNPNYKSYVDLRHNGRLMDMPLRSYVGFFVNNMEQEGQTFQNLADGHGTRGTLLANNRGTIRNIGGRFREELEFVPKWILAAGLGFEQSMVSVHSINYTNAGAFSSRADVDRTFYNWAPEMSLTWRPAEGYRHWVRASTGYSIPQFNQLTRNPSNGQPGANLDLKPQKNVNVEIGTESRLHKTLTVNLTGFWTFFRDEQITQNFGGGNTATINADSSEYRGVEVGYDWRPLEGWRFSGAYTHVDAHYINFNDTAVVGGAVRDGKKVPNVPTDVLNFKEEYDHAGTGWGGWFETSYYNSYFLNNANTVGIPAYWVMNANLHKNIEIKNHPYFKFAKFYAELDNIADKKYAASGQVVADSTADASKQLFFAGYGRSFYAGVTLGLW